VKGFEIERKYLLRPCLPGHTLRRLGVPYRKYFIQQYYLPERNGEYVRYRRRDDRYFKTIKSGEGMVRSEEEFEVDRALFEKYLDEHTGAVIEKERFLFEYQGVTYEMDRFTGKLAGLCYLEIEFDTVPSAESFVLPHIFSSLLLAEVTGDRRFNNASLSRNSVIPSLDTRLEVLVKKLSRTITPELSGLQYAVEPFESSGVAIRALLQDAAAHLARSRERLTGNGADPEALHHFRVAIRRCRSLLTLFRGFFPPMWYQLHHRNLSYLLDQSNTKRDIDVLLEKFPLYAPLLPKKFQEGLEVLREILLQRERLLATHIESLVQSELLLYEEASLERPKLLDSESAQPVVITAIAVLNVQIEKIIERGERLRHDSSAAAYHKLRIRFKRMRYFIEALKALVEEKRYREVERKMKKMQLLLGELHDCQVQRSLLADLSADPSIESKALRRTVEVLLELIGKQERRYTKRFKRKFKKILACEKTFRHLFEAV